MTESDSGEAPHTSEVPESPRVSPTPGSHEPPSLGYGNIYTPHAGSMIIHVQRESGLQSRMIVLGPHRVRLLRFLFSRGGKIALATALAILLMVVVEAARVPSLMHRVSRMEHTAERLDSLERSLGQLQRRYDQVRAMMGADSNAQLAATPQARSLTPLPAGAPRLGAAVSPDVDSQGGRTTPSAVGDDGSNNPTAAPQSATEVANPSEPDPSTAPVHHRRRHPVVEPPKDSGTTTPDSGADPSAQAEPQ